MSTTTTLDALKADIRAEYDALKSAARKTLGHARQIGTYLLRVKAEVAGRWMKWVELNCPFSNVTARKYVKVAAHWREFSDDELAEMTIETMADACPGSGSRRRRRPRRSPASLPPGWPN